ncbi:hypothetical protein N9E53_01290, partial [Amylibacter sp.]|nr:hypothetical protein [Amylibacter sp.]
MRILGKRFSPLIFNSSAYSVLAGLIITAVNFLIVINLSRESGIEQVGVVTFALSISALIKLFDVFGSGHTARHLGTLKNPQEHTCRVLVSVLVLNIGYYGVLGSLILFGVQYALQDQFYTLFRVQPSTVSLNLAGLVVLFNSSLASISGILDGLGKTYVRLWANIIVAVI